MCGRIHAECSTRDLDSQLSLESYYLMLKGKKGTPLNYSHRYRVVPSKHSQIMKGKTRRWSIKSATTQHSKGFDKKRQGVDFLGRDFIVLGKLIYMLGVCMRCASLHPEASALASPLLEMLRMREICGHKEAYVRKSVLFAASSILVSLHPSFIASSITTGNGEVANGLEWIQTWAIGITESDADRECYMMAMSCLQLHAEIALQVSRALESTENASRPTQKVVASAFILPMCSWEPSKSHTQI